MLCIQGKNSFFCFNPPAGVMSIVKNKKTKDMYWCVQTKEEFEHMPEDGIVYVINKDSGNLGGTKKFMKSYLDYIDTTEDYFKKQVEKHETGNK